MNALSELFNGLIFVKVEMKIVNGAQFDVYAANIANSYTNDKSNYILIFYNYSMYSPDKIRFNQNVNWKCVSARILKDSEVPPTYYNLPQQKLVLPPNTPATNPLLQLKVRHDLNTVYELKDGIHTFEFALLHDPKKKSNYQYSDHMKLVNAFLTYSCVCTNKTPLIDYSFEAL